MDIGTMIGLALACGLMITAILQGGPLGIFMNLPSAMIVFGGTIGVALVHYPLKDIVGAFSTAKKTFFNRDEDPFGLILQLMEFANKARKEGILSLQGMMESVEDEFLVKAMQMAVDGQEPDTLKAMLTTEIEYLVARHDKGQDIFSSLAGYAPAMGMVGTLIGLVQMLMNMSDPDSIGPAMAVALLTTLYGAVLANVFCAPMAGKLKNRSASETLMKNLVIEGMQSILSGENPRIMEQKLHAFISPSLRESTFK